MEAENLNERPRGPLQESEGSSMRWIIAVFAIALLGLGGYRGYQWWVADLESQRVETVQGQGTVAGPTSTTPESDLAPPGPVSVQPAKTSPRPAPSGEPLPPAVVGGRIQKCILDGKVTYTDEACAAGASMEPARDKMAATAPFLAADARPSQRDAACRYLSAEVSRLDYEFQQTLPPPVLDAIASDLKSMREQASHLKCPIALNEPVNPKTNTKVIQEKEKR
ncbi:hypothetical protein [Ottowia caeni]|uniref:hypothetical protein n=1 Tax=Ottowia caeni TaxID=2870339 RepID=UPI001E3F3D25|nr:hypothetical protein [Ottowia caeni]